MHICTLFLLSQKVSLVREGRMMLTQQPILTLNSYEAEMDEMVVMEDLDLEDQLAGMVSMDRKERLEPLDHRDLLDPGVVESLM